MIFINLMVLEAEFSFFIAAKQDQDEDVVSPPVNYERYRTFELREGIDTDHLERDQERIKIDQKEIS